MREVFGQIFQLNHRLINRILAGTFVLSLLLGAQSAIAQQNKPANNNKNQNSSQGTNSATQVSVESSSASVSQLKYRGTILADVKMKAGTKEKQCRWVNGGYNSGHGADGGLYWFYDPIRAKICKNSNSPTGWVKVAGGQTGRQCYNPYKPNGGPPGRVVRGPVVMVQSFQGLNLRAKAVADVRVKASKVCADGAKLSGRASARASANIRVTQSMLAKAKGNTEHVRIQIKSQISAQAKAKAVAKVKLNCGNAQPTPPTPTPPKPPAPGENTKVVVKQQQKIVNTTPSSDTSSDSGTVTPASDSTYYGSSDVGTLPDTGPGAMVATFMGVTSGSTLAFRLFLRRFGGE